jgi:hypothetical protein
MVGDGVASEFSIAHVQYDIGKGELSLDSGASIRLAAIGKNIPTT